MLSFTLTSNFTESLYFVSTSFDSIVVLIFSFSGVVLEGSSPNLFVSLIDTLSVSPLDNLLLSLALSVISFTVLISDPELSDITSLSYPLLLSALSLQPG